MRIKPPDFCVAPTPGMRPCSHSTTRRFPAAVRANAMLDPMIPPPTMSTSARDCITPSPQLLPPCVERLQGPLRLERHHAERRRVADAVRALGQAVDIYPDLEAI